MSIDLINPKDFDFISTKMREFFKKKGLIEVAAQHRLSILAACEDPTTVSSFDYCGQVWPLPQTSQMWLEYELMTKPDVQDISAVVQVIDKNQMLFTVVII